MEELDLGQVLGHCLELFKRSESLVLGLEEVDPYEGGLVVSEDAAVTGTTN